MVYKLQKHLVQSDDRLLSLGFDPKEYDYVDVVEDFSQEFAAHRSGELLSYYLTLGKEGFMTVRTIYTIWDVLGEIGGLIDMLSYMAIPVIGAINIIFGNGLSKFLLSNLFLR